MFVKVSKYHEVVRLIALNDTLKATTDYHDYVTIYGLIGL